MSQQNFLGDNLVVLANGFNRSTNLELDFEDTKRLNDVYLTDKFVTGMTEVLVSINNANSNQRVRVLSGSPGLGKSTFALVAANLVSKRSPRVIKAKIEEVEGNLGKTLASEYETFQKGKKTKLLPVFLNGYIGDINDAFVQKLEHAFGTIGLQKEFEKLMSAGAEAHLGTLNKWYKSYPDIYKKYLKLLKEEGLTEDQFEKALKKGKADARETFERIYADVTGGAAHVGKNSGDVVELYKRAIEALQDNGYHGIFVVYDEFGKYLERGIHNPSSLNIQFLQDFAEFCDRSGESQCHLTLITHLSVSQYATQLPVSIQKEWAKIEGRFHESVFYDRGTGHYEMIAHVFEKSIKETKPALYKKVKKFNEDFLANVKGKGLAPFYEKTGVSEVLTTCYPLHPIVLAVLPLLSQKVAQNERTLYTFLTRDEEHSLRRYLSSGLDHKEPNFLGMWELYQYFAPLIGKDAGIGGSYKIGLMMDEALGKIAAEDVLGRELMSMIALCSIVKNFVLTPMSVEFIASVYSGLCKKDEVAQKLTDLTKMKVLFFNKVQKQYELQQGSSVDVDEEIEKYRSVKLTGKDLVRIVKGYFPQDFLIPKRYNFDHSITRFAPVEFISVEELKAGRFKKAPEYGREDALAYYVVPFDQEELVIARQIATTSDLPLVTFILPKSFVECRRDIEELNAVNTLFNDKEVLSAGPLVRKELERHKALTLAAIRSVLEPLAGKFSLQAEFIYSPQKMKISVGHYSELLQRLGDVFKAEYSKTVVLNSEHINKHKVTGNITLARKIMVDALIFKRQEKNLGFEGNGPEVTMYRAFHNMAGFRYVGEEKRLTIQKESALFRLYQDYQAWLIEAESRGLEVNELFQKMMAPPYGLRKALIPMYLAVFDQMLEYPVSHYAQGQYLQKVDGEHYEMMLKHPKECLVKYTVISATKARYLNLMGEVFGLKPQSQTVGTVLEAIYKWRKMIPDYTKDNPQVDAPLRKFMIAIDSATEPERLLFKSIPDAFDMNEVVEGLEKKQVDAIVAFTEKATKRLPQYYVELIKGIHGSLVEFLQFMQEVCLGETPVKYSQGMNLSEIYKQTLSRFPADLATYPYNKLTGNFLSRIRTFDTTKHPQYFVETMGDVLTQSSPRSWSEKGRSLFEANLLKVRTEIEMVFELLGAEFKGQSVVAFINRQTGEKEYMRLGVLGRVKEAHVELKDQIGDMLAELDPRQRNALLMDLLVKESSEDSKVGVKGISGGWIK
jgi:hypothetical protein